MQGPEESGEASQDMMLMSKRMRANGTWQPVLGATKIIFKVTVWSISLSSFFFYMELVKNLRGQCCFSRRAQLESAQSATGKAQDRGRLNPPPRTSLATFIILVMSQELKDGSALPAVITLLQFAVKTYRSILCRR